MSLRNVIIPFIIGTISLFTYCSMATTQITPYPASWPKLATHDTNCKYIEGRYLNRGQVTGDLKSLSVALLSSILTNEEPPQAFTLTIAVVSDSEIAINVYDATRQAPISIRLKKNTAFTCKSGIATLSWGHGALDAMGTYIESRALTLYKAIDGSLIVEKHYSGQGVIFLVPFHDRIHSWYRFEQVTE